MVSPDSYHDTYRLIHIGFCISPATLDDNFDYAASHVIRNKLLIIYK